MKLLPEEYNLMKSLARMHSSNRTAKQDKHLAFLRAKFKSGHCETKGCEYEFKGQGSLYANPIDHIRCYGCGEKVDTSLKDYFRAYSDVVFRAVDLYFSALELGTDTHLGDAVDYATKGARGLQGKEPFSEQIIISAAQNLSQLWLHPTEKPGREEILQLGETIATAEDIRVALEKVGKLAKSVQGVEEHKREFLKMLKEQYASYDKISTLLRDLEET